MELCLAKDTIVHKKKIYQVPIACTTNMIKALCKLLDVAQKANTTHYPVLWTHITFKVNRTNIVEISSTRFSVNTAFIQLTVLS